MQYDPRVSPPKPFDPRVSPLHLSLDAAAELHDVPLNDLRWLQEHALLGEATQFDDGVRLYNAAAVASAVDLWRVAFSRAAIVCPDLPRYKRSQALLHDVTFVRASAGHLAVLALGSGAR